MSKLAVQLVTWNGEKYISHLFDSLKKQTFSDWELFVHDNGSKDQTVKAIKKQLDTFPVQYHTTFQKENDGFAGGHNAVFKKHNAPYVLLLNQDMVLESDCFERLVAYAEANKDVAAIAPRLMRWDFDKNFTDDVDALGLKVFRSRRVVEQETKKKWSDIKKRFTDVLPVFGVSGALPLYRRTALEDVAFEDGTFFDESYGSYKEDVDLAFRLQAKGYESVVLTDVVAYHDRTGAGPEQLSDAAALQNKRSQSSWVKYHSYKNHLATLYKNESPQSLLLDFPWIFWYEMKKFLYFLLLDRSVLKGLGELWENRKALSKKRKRIQSSRTQSPKQLRVWWT